MALRDMSNLILMQFFCVPTYCSMNMHYISDQKRLLIKIITELIRKNHPGQQEIIIMTNIYIVLTNCQSVRLLCMAYSGYLGNMKLFQRGSHCF